MDADALDFLLHTPTSPGRLPSPARPDHLPTPGGRRQPHPPGQLSRLRELRRNHDAEVRLICAHELVQDGPPAPESAHGY
ncbi:hypothetical protein [Kitasatospora sp. NPDC001175]|uniref:hypothetical protein n=1 Tax=Kitasatospora sp. NPDC001175 TaxID=3157103 RepID=UPI003CFEAA41